MTATTPTASDFVLVDSSGWIEFIGDGPKADAFGKYLLREDSLIVPSIVIYEVHKKLTLTRNDSALKRFLSHAFRSRQVPFDADLAAAASRASIDHRLAMADAIIYASAQLYQAQLVTADLDFANLPNVVIP
ncbi:MAG: type II toxin-antitoxin system VapC family toxin [Candidatus Acidiferrales bacterium]